MVIKKRYHDGIGNPPPPMDESWWEAVLAEEVSQSAPTAARNTRPANHTSNIHSSNNNDFQDGESDAATLDWQKALELYEQDQVIQMQATGCIRGGLLVSTE